MAESLIFRAQTMGGTKQAERSRRKEPEMIEAAHSPPRHCCSSLGCLSANEKIDICRGLFAFLVVSAHAVDISWALHPEIPGRLSGHLHDLMLYVAAAGVYWVIGFFAISGYCIQLSVERLLAEKAFSLRHYLLARLSRILPLYYLALLLAVVIERCISSSRPSCWPQGVDSSALVAQLFVVQNLIQTYGSFAPSWSITNEMFYYVLYGAVVHAAAWRGIRSTMLGMSLCVTLALILDWVYFSGYRTGYVRSTGLLFGLGIIWFQGALVAEHRARLCRSRLARVISGFWPFVLILAMAMWYSQAVHLQVVYLVLGIAFTLMLMRFVVTELREVRRNDRGCAPALIRLLGLASYPTYLFHGPIVMLTGSLILRWNLISDWRLTWMILTGVGIGSGILLGYCAERPIMAWRAGYLNRLRRSRPAPGHGGVSPLLGVQQ
jgi:peptidoglycan/LPS O-acetylase OafA/YrhL